MSTIGIFLFVGGVIGFFLYHTVGYRKSFSEAVNGVVVQVKTQHEETLNPRTRQVETWIGYRAVVEFQWKGEPVQSIDCRSRERSPFFPGDKVTVYVNPKNLDEVWIEPRK